MLILVPNFWGLFCPWLLARCSYLGPFQEITTAIHVPIDASSGLDKVHFTWTGTFVLEALVYLFPDKHIILIDTDCVPTSLVEVEELVRMTQTHLEQATGVEPTLTTLRLRKTRPPLFRQGRRHFAKVDRISPPSRPKGVISRKNLTPAFLPMPSDIQNTKPQQLSSRAIPNTNPSISPHAI